MPPYYYCTPSVYTSGNYFHDCNFRQEDKFKIHSFHKEDNMYAAIENVTVTAINSMDMNGPQEFVVKAVDNDQLLPVSTAKTLLPFGMEKESLLSVENETVSVNEMKKIDYVNRGSTSDDSCKYASQHAYGFQSGSSLSHHTRYFSYRLHLVLLISRERENIMS